MEATARARYVRMSPRKVGQILDLIRGKHVSEAVGLLRFVNKAARPLVEKTLKSAFANAGKNASPDAFYVQGAWVGQGPVLKRMRAAAMGRGAVIRHKTTHLTITVSDQRKEIGKN